MNEDDDLNDMHFECFWSDLKELGTEHGERILDRDAWRESFDDGKSAKEAFFEEFPQHKQSNPHPSH